MELYLYSPCVPLSCVQNSLALLFYLSLFYPDSGSCKLQVSLKYWYLPTKLLSDVSQRLVLFPGPNNFASPCNILNETVLDRMARELSLITCNSIANSITLMFDHLCVCLSDSTVLVYVNFLNLPYHVV